MFNVEQADHVTRDRRDDQDNEPEWKAHQTAERVIQESGIHVAHVRGDRACYNMQTDTPKKSPITSCGRSATANRRSRNRIARWRRHTRPRAVRRSAPRRRRDRWTRARPRPWVPTLDLARMIVNPRGILSPDGRGDRALVTR